MLHAVLLSGRKEGFVGLEIDEYAHTVLGILEERRGYDRPTVRIPILRGFVSGLKCLFQF